MRRSAWREAARGHRLLARTSRRARVHSPARRTRLGLVVPRGRRAPARRGQLRTRPDQTKPPAECLLRLGRMTHLAAKKINLEDLWPELEAGISTMVTNLNQGFPYKKWIELYTYAAHRAHARLEALTLNSPTAMCIITAPRRALRRPTERTPRVVSRAPTLSVRTCTISSSNS